MARGSSHRPLILNDNWRTIPCLPATPSDFKLAERKFHQLTGKPVTPVPGRRFKPVKLNPARFDSGWDRKRGAAVRLTAVLLGEDDAALEQRVCGDERTRKTYSAAADWLQRESAYLRKVARLLDTAGARLTTVLGRCKASAAAS